MKEDIKMSLSLVGNIAHICNIGLVFMYARAMLKYGEKDGTPFDERWLEEGFCRAQDSFVEEMHLDSGLVMSIIAFPFVSFLYWKHSKSTSSFIKQERTEPQEETDTDETDEDESDNDKADSPSEFVEDQEETKDAALQYATNAMFGVVGHAIGHFIIFEALKSEIYPDGSMKAIDDIRNDSIGLIFRKIGPGYFLFWFPLLKSYMQNTNWAIVLLLAKFVLFGSLQIPIKFGFAYAQCCFFLCFSIDQLASTKKENKGLAFALYPLVTVIPSILISWIEATSCSTSDIMRSYGHVVYDAFMALSYPLFYVMCTVIEKRKVEKPKID